MVRSFFSQVQNGFQKFGVPSFLPAQGAPVGRGHLNPCLQGLQYAVRCLAQLTATQYAVTSCPGMAPPINRGRIIFICSLKRYITLLQVIIVVALC